MIRARSWSFKPSSQTVSRLRVARTLMVMTCCFASVALVTLPGVSNVSRLTIRRAFRSRPAQEFKYNRAKVRSMMSNATVAGGDGIIIPAPSGKADSSIIFLHGLGDTAHGWAHAFPLENLPNTRYVLPTAATRPVTMNMGMPMPAWFDIFGLTPDTEEDVNGTAAAVARVQQAVDSEIADGIAPDKIVVAGYSQGGAVALSYAVQTSSRLAGFFVLSTWLPLRNSYPDKLGPHAKSSKFLMCHGEVDEIVNPRFSAMSADFLKDLGLTIDYKTYAGLGHSANPQEMDDVNKFVVSLLR